MTASKAFRFNNLKIGTKVIGLLIVALVASSAISAFVLSRLKATNDVYAHLIEGNVTAMIAAREFDAAYQSTGRFIYRMLASNTTEAKERDYKAFVDQITRMQDALVILEKNASPVVAAELVEAKKGAADLKRVAPEVREPAIRGDNAGATAVMLRELRPIGERVGNVIIALKTKLGKELDDQKVATSSSVDSNILSSTVAIGAVFALSLLVGYWFSLMIVQRPLRRLTTEMERLAAGDHEVAISGSERGDEVGAVAKAAETFKQNAIERLRLENEADANRDAAESQRVEADRSRAARAAEQAAVVGALADGLSNVSRGDLTHQLTQDFPAEYVKLRDDFNTTVAQLRDAMAAVITSANSIRSGSDEIAQASDDLSRRTEQQAASLEQTAAAPMAAPRWP